MRLASCTASRQHGSHVAVAYDTHNNHIAVIADTTYLSELTMAILVSTSLSSLSFFLAFGAMAPRPTPEGAHLFSILRSSGAFSTRWSRSKVRQAQCRH